MNTIDNSLNINDMIQLLMAKPLMYGPASVEVFVASPDDLYELDAIIELRFDGQSSLFAAEFKSNTWPKSFEQGLAYLSRVSQKSGLPPLLVLPWLSDERISELSRRKISGIDLCGNAFIYLKEKLLIYKTGGENKYKEQRSIRKIFSGESSLVARVFAQKPLYSSIKEIHEEIHLRNGRLAMSTISKVLKELEHDLVISKDFGVIRLLQSDKLLESLRNRYKAPTKIRSIRGHCEEPNAQVLNLMHAFPDQAILTGASSAKYYSAMATEPIISIYTSLEPETVFKVLDSKFVETNRFPNIEIFQTSDHFPFFDLNTIDDIKIASIVQVWLELSHGDKRHQDTAEFLKQAIIRNIASAFEER